MKSSLAVMTLVAIVGFGPAVVRADQTGKVATKETVKVENKETTTSNDQAVLQKEAKISMEKAGAIALKKVPGGKIESAELEREHGKLIYSFDVRTSRPGVTEVNVDAINGKIVAISQESPAKEAAEKKQEAKEKGTGSAQMP